MSFLKLITFNNGKIAISRPLLCRLSSNYGPNDDISPIIVNRNPLNLERMRIGYKPSGYIIDKPGKNFWNKLELITGGRHVTAQVIHHKNGPIIEASTKEWALKKQLYRHKDTSAFINLARVFAQRCHECGIYELACYIEPGSSTKISKFLETIVSEGIVLGEEDQFKTPYAFDKERETKPWSPEQQLM